MEVNAIVGIRTGEDKVRAIKVMGQRTDPCLLGYVLLRYYPKRTKTLPLILGGSADYDYVRETFLSTEYNNLDQSKWYDSARQLIYEEVSATFFYVQDTDDTWYVCFGDWYKWIRLDSIVTGEVDAD